MESKFIGFWSGIVQGSYNGNILVRIKGFKSFLSAQAMLFSDNGERDLVKLKGEEKEANISEFSLTEYNSSGSNVIIPREGKVKLTIQDAAAEIKGEWSTDIGTIGKLRLRRANNWEEKLLLVPSPIYIVYLKLVKNLNFPNLYLLFVLILVLSSLSGWITKLSTIEGIILLIPIVYLFRFEFRKVLGELGVKKLGSFEFYQQGIPPNYQQIIYRLENMFGERKFIHFFYLDRFFVPKTKILLSKLASFLEPLTLVEFVRLAKSLDIQDDNINATLQALSESNCVHVDSERGKISLTDYGRDFLMFESIISNFRST